MKGRCLLTSLAMAVLASALFSTTTAANQNFSIDGQVRSTGPPKSVPGQLNYQGYLAHTADSAAVTATLEMTFRLFDSETKGAELWSETHTMVAVSEGLFQVLLGSVTPFPAGLFDGSTLWLQTEVGTEVLVPRKPVVSAAYSQMAGTAGHAATADWATDAQNAVHADTADYYPGVSAWTVSGDDVYRETGKVGIGTTTPLTELDVTGSVNATTYYGDGSNLTGISGTTDNDWAIAGNHMYSAVPGSVGIGTTSPASKLHLQGILTVGQDSSGHDIIIYGDSPNSKLWWFAEKYSLRAGLDTNGSEWAPDSVGSYSFAAGRNTRASGPGSAAMGSLSEATGSNSFVAGYQNTASASNAVALGGFNQATDEYATVLGSSSKAHGGHSLAWGYQAVASGLGSMALGTYVQAGEADFTNVIGHGISIGSRLVNDIENSFMVGFNSTTPTLFVESRFVLI
jgi:hypothetical protein